MRKLMRIDIQAPDIARAAGELRRRVSQALHRGALEISRDARQGAPSAMGLLANSVRVDQVNDLEFHVVAGQRYAGAAEFGTPPGRWVPRNDLRDWARAKLGSTDAGLIGAIRRSIFLRGTRAQPFMQPALDNNADRLRRLVRQALEG